MNEHPVLRFSIYALFALLVISSVVLAMPGAFAPAKDDHTKDALGAPLPEGQHRLHLNQTFSIRGISFTFKRVESDNRCPQGAQCLTRGEAILVMHVNTSSTEEDIRLSTALPTLYGPFTIQVIGLTPTPAEGDMAAEATIEIIDASSLE